MTRRFCLIEMYVLYKINQVPLSDLVNILRIGELSKLSVRITTLKPGPAPVPVVTSGWRKKQVAPIVKIYTRNRNKKNARPHAPSSLIVAYSPYKVCSCHHFRHSFVNRWLNVIHSDEQISILTEICWKKISIKSCNNLTGEESEERRGEERRDLPFDWHFRMVQASVWYAQHSHKMVAAPLLSRNVYLFKFISKRDICTSYKDT